jgi:hypothetical protein
LIARAWVDPDFKEQLMSNPEEVLAEHGITTRGTVYIHEDTQHETHISIPMRPADLSDEDLMNHPHPDLCSHE